MSSQSPPPEPRRSDRSPWNWLLAVPVVLPLLTFVYNREEPRVAGFPAYYWMQLTFIPLAVVCTLVVYRRTRRGRNPGGDRVE
ncbi:DUF3311 domain-containing protein [Actinomadura flavalba]|uniref:DUF3311 domain-containing protein n=1 Tax=Actinomadura flavalba TaxID=1120938 RepID=UPI00036EEEEE|nr:DUF3311 domain-containing protein [Actinomadura flavalba]